MKDTRRREGARLRAEAYAPAPADSRLLYGVIAASMLLLSLVAAGAFYAIDLFQHPLIIAVLVVLAFGAGLLFRRRQARRHRRAHREEYDGMGEGGAAE